MQFDECFALGCFAVIAWCAVICALTLIRIARTLYALSGSLDLLTLGKTAKPIFTAPPFPPRGNDYGVSDAQVISFLYRRCIGVSWLDNEAQEHTNRGGNCILALRKEVARELEVKQ